MIRMSDLPPSFHPRLSSMYPIPEHDYPLASNSTLTLHVSAGITLYTFDQNSRLVESSPRLISEVPRCSSSISDGVMIVPPLASAAV